MAIWHTSFRAVLGGLLVVFMGCTPELVDYRAPVAAGLALESLRQELPPPGPAPEPEDTTHSRDDCPTGGWVTHGDGHQTRCQDCRPEWEDGAPVAVESPVTHSEQKPLSDPKPVAKPSAASQGSSSEASRSSGRRLLRGRLFRR